MLEVHTANKMLADGVDLEYLATACVGMTGAQLATLANTAALRAVLENRDEITQVTVGRRARTRVTGHWRSGTRVLLEGKDSGNWSLEVRYSGITGGQGLG